MTSFTTRRQMKAAFLIRGLAFCLVCMFHIHMQAVEQASEYTQEQVKEQGRLVTNNKFLQGALKQDHGKGWEILRSDNGMVPNTGITESNPYGYKCRWSWFESTSGHIAQMCVHDFFDIVSKSIIGSKRWKDCDILPKLWSTTSTGDNTDDGDGLYVEVGANIGACILEMLLSTNANIIAFEPHPRNLFHLRSTISKLDPSMQDRVVIVPTALGGHRQHQRYIQPRIIWATVW
mmetsp:Transcript_38686/g.81070  ORF Transcript_38686/g.81070 Transcript_38686/m.81070 type:complete len:233 (+) Transcript_38686:52-750(+)